jgi:DNA-binding Lrp family transcriptional regulator
MEMTKWVRLPSDWINEGGLKELRWGSDGLGSNSTAALMILVAIAHVTDDKSGVARTTYDGLQGATGLSRAKLSNGLDLLERIGVIKRAPEGRSTYKLSRFDPTKGWAKLPARSMYSSGRIVAFDDFKLRRVVELDALKLFFLFVARRDRNTNMAKISYGTIQEYSGVERVRIKTAISFLASLSLVYVERVPSKSNEYGVANAYRIVGVDTSIHMGTIGRSMDSYDFDSI